MIASTVRGDYSAEATSIRIEPNPEIVNGDILRVSPLGELVLVLANDGGHLVISRNVSAGEPDPITDGARVVVRYRCA